jgi:hypothetical protein
VRSFGAIPFCQVLAGEEVQGEAGAEDGEEVFGDGDGPVGAADSLDQVAADHEAGEGAQSRADRSEERATEGGAMHGGGGDGADQAAEDDAGRQREGRGAAAGAGQLVVDEFAKREQCEDGHGGRMGGPGRPGPLHREVAEVGKPAEDGDGGEGAQAVGEAEKRDRE